MTHRIGFILCGVLLTGGTLLGPTCADAESRGGNAMGIVTTLSGEVTVTRAELPQRNLPLKFKDEVFQHDRISTREHSLARVLLGGKSLVTIRELSDLTVTENPGQPSFINLLGGKISLAVAKLRMRPGESIEVRTPNAIAAVRGTVLVVEVTPMLGKSTSIQDMRPRHAMLTGEESGIATTVAEVPEFLTTIHVLKGNVDIFDLAGNLKGNLQGGFNITVTGGAFGKPSPNPPVPQVVGDLKSDPQVTDSPAETIETLSLNQLAGLKGLEGPLDLPLISQMPPTASFNNVIISTTGSTLPHNADVNSTGGSTRLTGGQ